MKKIRLWKNRTELSDIYATVDDEDYQRAIDAVTSYNKDGSPRKGTGKYYAWRGGNKWYANNGSRYKSLHRVIMNPPADKDVDHINGDTLDNRKENLRICTRSQNMMNKALRSDSSTGFKGVYEVKHGGKYTKKSGEVVIYGPPKKRFRAYIGNPDSPATRKRHLRLGYYSTAEEAAEAYDRKAVELYGEFALLNFPEKLEQYLKVGTVIE